jgi:LacI family transcriptional regulator, fructose operon transcriptional repressor
MATGKTTIYDIARLAKTSPSTVSAVLNGSWTRRRIGKKLVDKITRLAAEQGYSANMQARGLRQARSGLVGMIIPLHDTRFFSSLSQHFDAMARERGLCPVIASTLRNPEEERRVVETFISYSVDAIFIAGASDPEQLGALCTTAKLKHIFIDLPGHDAPSVVTDNFDGAYRLTEKIIETMKERLLPVARDLYFVGGAPKDHATQQRVRGFRAALDRAGAAINDNHIIQCGYVPSDVSRIVAELNQRIGSLPAGLFVNSLTAFEGVMSHVARLPASAFDNSVIGCFDHDPLAAFLQFPVHMVRQDSLGLIAKAYELLDEGETSPLMYEVKPQLIAPRTIAEGSIASLG